MASPFLFEDEKETEGEEYFKSRTLEMLKSRLVNKSDNVILREGDDLSTEGPK